MSTPMKFPWSARHPMIKDPIVEAVKAGDMAKAKRLQNHAARMFEYDNDSFTTAAAPPQSANSLPDKWSNYDKLKMRLGLDKSADFGVDYCNIFETTGKVFVFVVANQCADVLEDEKGSFPSDKLVAKFHLIRSSK